VALYRGRRLPTSLEFTAGSVMPGGVSGIGARGERRASYRLVLCTMLITLENLLAVLAATVSCLRFAQWRRMRWSLAVVSLLSSLQLFLGWGIGLGLLIGSVALARSSSRQAIPTGLGQEAQFTAQSDRTRILKKPHTPDSDLALAVALGIGNEYMTAAAQTGAPVPSWLYSRSYTITWDHVRALVEQPGRGWPFSASSITGIGH